MLKQYEMMTWMEFEESRLKDELFVLCVGACEEHGPHMPMGYDLFSGYELVKRKVSQRYDVVVLPPLYYGYRSQVNVGGGDLFPGTLRISSESVIYTVRDITMEMFRHRIKHFLVMCSHLENKYFIIEGIEKAFAEYKGEIKTKVILSGWSQYIKPETLDALFDGKFPGWDPEHAALCETSFMLALWPEIVNMDLLPDESAPRYAKYSVWPSRKEFVTQNGALAPADRSSLEKGELMMKDVLEGLFADLDYEYKGIG